MHEWDTAGTRWRLQWAALGFRGDRANYYEYLADVMEGTGGGKTLRDIFLSDAERYGLGHRRGLLSAHWARQHEEGGGDLLETFRDTLPADDLVLLRMAQRGGAGALEQTLRDVAAVTRLVDRARDMFVATIAVGALAMLVMFATVLAVPWFTVPRLKQVFGMVPDDFVGVAAHRLYAFAASVDDYLIPLVLGGCVLAYLFVWSLPNLTGPLRSRLDEWFLWRLYRDFQGVRFLASLATMVKKRGNVTTSLRDALALQSDAATPWRRWQVDKMIARIDDGKVGSTTFDTGVVDKETLWFLTDLVAAQGMDAALLRVRGRIESRALRRVERRAVATRWTLLVLAVSILFAILSWHFVVINEMRGAMTNYYSSR